jgi:hypothetical protein
VIIKVISHHFTLFDFDGITCQISQMNLVKDTFLAGSHRRNTERYLKENKLAIDPGWSQRDYDLVVTCTDLVVQNNIRLHPLENVRRATREINQYVPGAMVLSEGNTDHMIANCKVRSREIQL